MIGKQAGRKANKKLVNGAAFQVGRKATTGDLKTTLCGKAAPRSVFISLAPDVPREGCKEMQLQKPRWAQVHSKPCQGTCRASVSRFSAKD